MEFELQSWLCGTVDVEVRVCRSTIIKSVIEITIIEIEVDNLVSKMIIGRFSHEVQNVMVSEGTYLHSFQLSNSYQRHT